MNEGFSQEKFAEINNVLQVINCLSSENTRLTEELDQRQKELEFAQSKVKWFEEQVKLGKQRQFGKKSEANLGIQLNLFDGLETTEGKPNQPKKVVTITYTRTYNQGRRIDTSKLPREKITHDLTEAEKTCKCCGKELTKIGEDVSEQLEYIPAKIKVIAHITPKYTCRNCCTIKMAKKER